MYQTMNIVIFEDDKTFRDVLSRMIETVHLPRYPGDEIVIASGSAKEVEQYIRASSEYTVYLLDIVVGRKTAGYDLAKQIRALHPGAPVIFITGHAEVFVSRMEYKLLANGFIFKDSGLLRDELADALEYFRRQIKNGGALEIRSRFYHAYVAYDEIYYLETISGAVKVKVVCRKRVYDICGTLRQVQAQLDSRFVRVSRFCVVNRDKIVRLDHSSHRIELEDGYAVPFSDAYYKEGGEGYADHNL